MLGLLKFCRTPLDAAPIEQFGPLIENFNLLISLTHYFGLNLTLHGPGFECHRFQPVPVSSLF